MRCWTLHKKTLCCVSFLFFFSPCLLIRVKKLSRNCCIHLKGWFLRRGVNQSTKWKTSQSRASWAHMWCGYHDSHLGYIGVRWLLSSLYHASWSQVLLQVFRERLSEKMCMQQSQKVIGIWSIHCSWHCSCWTYFCCFLSALANICPWPLLSFF